MASNQALFTVPAALTDLAGDPRDRRMSAWGRFWRRSDSSPKVDSYSERARDASLADGVALAPLGAQDADLLAACRVAAFTMGAIGLRSLGVTSAIRGEGRSTVARAMAHLQWADYGRNCVLVDLDFERSWLSRRGLGFAPGVAELLRAEFSVDSAIRELAPGLFFLPSGRVNGDAARLAILLADSLLMEKLAERFDVVVADLPPLLASSYGRLAAASLQVLVLVVRAGATPAARIREATEGLVNQPVVLLNGTHTRLPHWLESLTES